MTHKTIAIGTILPSVAEHVLACRRPLLTSRDFKAASNAVPQR